MEFLITKEKWALLQFKKMTKPPNIGKILEKSRKRAQIRFQNALRKINARWQKIELVKIPVELEINLRHI